jgi:hypothetical protein
MGLGKRAQRFISDPLEDMFKSTEQSEALQETVQEMQEGLFMGQKGALEEQNASCVGVTMENKKRSCTGQGEGFSSQYVQRKEKKIAVQEMQESEATQLKSFLLPISVHRQLKEQAFKHDVTMTRIVRMALQEWFENHAL